METFDSPLTVYCSKGRVTNLRFKSCGSEIKEHMKQALERLGVTQHLQEMVERDLDHPDFAPGFKFERHDSSIGPGQLDSDEPEDPDAKRVVVYISYYHQQLQEYIDVTCGKLMDFEEVMKAEDDSQAEEDDNGPAVNEEVTWRQSA